MSDAWQPIETAPPNKILLLFGVTDVQDGVVTNWKMATGCRGYNGAWIWDGIQLDAWHHVPTHWMSLPEPPDLGSQP